MNANTAPATTQSTPERPAKAKSKFTFARLLLGLLVTLCVAAVAFWYFNIRQPGVSYQRPDPSHTTATTETALQQPVQTQPATETAQTDDAATEKPLSTADALKKHIVHLATTIGERNLRTYDKLNEAADFIEAEFKSYGYKPKRQTYQVHNKDCYNIDVEIKGSKLPNEVVIIGAHYDSVVGTPGANDNGSGTAAMLVLAKHFAKSAPERSLRFVAWTNEEPPYFQNRGLMGSWVYAEKCRVEKQDIVAVLSLETMGYYSDAKDSQHYPKPLNLLYPSTGNFVGFVSNTKSRGLQREVIKTFRKHAKIPSEGASLPEAVQGVGWSDHWSFWQEGYAGLMVTDTAPFRYPHYHKATDTPDKVNFPEMAKVVEGLKFVVMDQAKIKAPEDPAEDQSPTNLTSQNRSCSNKNSAKPSQTNPKSICPQKVQGSRGSSVVATTFVAALDQTAIATAS